MSGQHRVEHGVVPEGAVGLAQHSGLVAPQEVGWLTERSTADQQLVVSAVDVDPSPYQRRPVGAQHLEVLDGDGVGPVPREPPLPQDVRRDEPPELFGCHVSWNQKKP